VLHQALGGDRRHHLASVVRPLAPAVAQREGEGVGEVRRTKDAASQQRLDDDHCGEIQEKRHGETCFEIVVGHCRIALPDEASGRYRRCVEGRTTSCDLTWHKSHSAEVLDQSRPCTVASPAVLSGLRGVFRHRTRAHAKLNVDLPECAFDRLA
jgi:hypothetical protein